MKLTRNNLAQESFLLTDKSLSWIAVAPQGHLFRLNRKPVPLRGDR